MSYTELHYGKLKKIERSEGVTLEDLAESICKENGLLKKDDEETWVDTIKYYSGLDEKYFVSENEIYEFIEHHKQDDNEYFQSATENADGTISFVNLFYNGGTCFNECLSEELEKIENKENEIKN